MAGSSSLGAPRCRAAALRQCRDPTSLTFSTEYDLPEPIADATVLDDGRILLIDGASSSRTHILEPMTGAYAFESSLTRAWQPRVIRLADGRVLLVGGLADGKLRPEGGGTSAPGVSTVEVFQ